MNYDLAGKKLMGLGLIALGVFMFGYILVDGVSLLSLFGGACVMVTFGYIGYGLFNEGKL